MGIRAIGPPYSLQACSESSLEYALGRRESARPIELGTCPIRSCQKAHRTGIEAILPILNIQCKIHHPSEVCEHCCRSQNSNVPVHVVRWDTGKGQMLLVNERTALTCRVCTTPVQKACWSMKSLSETSARPSAYTESSTRSKCCAHDLRTKYAVFSNVPGSKCDPFPGRFVGLSGISSSIFLRAWASEMKDVPTRSVITVSDESALGNKA